MARRAASYDSNDSLKENNGIPPVNGAKKASAEKAARSKRAAMRKHVEVEEEHEQEDQEDDGAAGGRVDEDEAEGDEDQDGAHSPKGRKRARANTNGDAHPSGSNSGPKFEKRTHPRDNDGFIPGSIVRIQLCNFLTYDYVEFKPGPYLNMVFGPNGTGKSSIACAICLGLNFPPSLLNRAQDLKSFVKNDKDKGYIEIELKGAKGKGNLVIRRDLDIAQKTGFKLNGANASGKEINARMAELNVQVSNLCAFLPQDRVAEFARMTPQQLLRETQRAAGNENLTAWHDTLISSGKELRQIQDLVDNDREQLKTMEERNANLERDVKRYEERQVLEKRINLLELIIPFKEYYDAREKYRELKPKYKEVTRNFKRMQAVHAPYVAMEKAMDDDLKRRDQARDTRKTAAKHKFRVMSQKWEENDLLEQQMDSVKSDLNNLKKKEKDRLSNIKRLERIIEETQHQLDNPPETEDLDEINSQIRKLNRERSQTNNRLSELQAAQQENINKSAFCKQQIGFIHQQLHQLDSQSHQKLAELSKFDRDSASVVEWLRDNRKRFKMEIFEPAMLCVTIPNRQYVDAVEACFAGTQMRTFVAQCEEDYQLLNRLCVDTNEALGRKVRINTWYRVHDESKLLPPPVPAEQLQAYGFDGYAIDFIDCPEGLRWFLCSEVRLHRTALAVRKPQAVDPNRAMAMAAASQQGANYVVGRVMNIVKRSNYGKHLPTNRTSQINPARNLAFATVDPQVKRDLQAKLADAEQNLAEANREEQTLSEQDKEIRAEHRLYKESFETLDTRKQAVLDARKKFQSLTLKLQKDQASLQKIQNEPPADERRKELKQKLLQFSAQRAKIVQQYIKLMRDSIKDQVEMTKAGLEMLQVSANKSALEVRCREQKEEIDRAQAEWQDIRTRYAAAKQASIEKVAVSRAKINEVEKDIRDRFMTLDQSGEIRDKPVEEWQAELDQSLEELEMNMATNANVVDQYNRRKAEIETLNATVEERERRIERIQRSIQTARDNWQPALQTLVQSIGKKFSGAFDRIGCAGEIRIREDEDYEKWAIDIMVKFRDHEKLQLLTGERQSGGERSLTTILYLMSLTEEARAPFSLVDEINQGMDQRAERAVHNSLVEVTCQPDSGQYFLITPKLLPDLNYHERMRILCVNNGEWLTEETSMGNMMGLIDNYLLFQRSGGNASM